MSPLEPSPILVLGGSGFLGVQVLELCLEGDSRVTSLSRDPGSAGPTQADGLQLLSLDLSVASRLESVLESLRPRLILNCAALSRVSDCEQDSKAAHALNAAVPAKLAAYSAGQACRLIHVSTDLVFDGEAPRSSGYREDDEAIPLSHYGQSKLEGEQVVLELDPMALVVRLPLLFGDSGGRGLGASDSLLARVGAGQAAPLFTDERRTPLEVRAAARALLKLAGTEAHGRLHVAGPLSMTRYELGCLVLRSAGWGEAEIARSLQAVRQADLDLQPPRPRDVSLDATRSLRWLGAPLPTPHESLGLERSTGTPPS